MSVSRYIQNIGVYLTIIITQQYFLTFLPNIQLTFLLILIFVRTHRIYESCILIVSYVLLVGLIYGFSIFTVFTLLSWLLMLVFKWKVNLILVILISILQMWIYIPMSLVMYNVSLWYYLMSDIPFTMIYITNNVLLWIWLYERLEKVID
jgi:hypothetical protein